MKYLMARTYTQKRRAEQQADTRRRIVEAAVDLHTRLGPGRTPLSLVAEQAGVQRHTLYAHFPDEKALLMACSGHVAERDPPPDAQAWRAIADPAARLQTGLGAIYDWFERNEQVTASVLRDADYHPIVREVQTLRTAPAFAAFHDVLGAGLASEQRAMLALALSFHTWRSLRRDGGLSQAAATMAMTQAITNAGR